MKSWVGVLGLGLWMAMGVAQAGTAVLPKGAVLIDAATAKSDPARLALGAGAVVERVAAGDDDGALARLQAIDDPLAFELTAARVIDALSASGGGEALLAALEDVPARVYRRHEETRANWFLPVFDIGAQAKSLRALRARQQRAVALRGELLADPAGAMTRAGEWADAVALLSATEVDRVADALLAKRPAVEPRAQGAPRTKADPGRPAAADAPTSVAKSAAVDARAIVALAARGKRAEVWEWALEAGEPLEVMPLFERLGQLSAAEAKAWTARAARDPRYASAAVLARAGLRAEATSAPLARSRASASPAPSALSPDAGDALSAWLDDPALGASAAAALAQREGDAFVAKVDALAGPGASAQRLQRLALALRLIDTPAANQRLHALAQDPRLPAHVRAELQR